MSIDTMLQFQEEVAMTDDGRKYVKLGVEAAKSQGVDPVTLLEALQVEMETTYSETHQMLNSGDVIRVAKHLGIELK